MVTGEMARGWERIRGKKHDEYDLKSYALQYIKIYISKSRYNSWSGDSTIATVCNNSKYKQEDTITSAERQKL